MTSQDLDHLIADVRGMIRSQLRIRGRSLQAQLKRAGRLLPKKIRQDALSLIEARKLAENPKLARQVDPAAVTAAHDAIRDHLMQIDPKERRKDRILGLLGVLAFNVLLIGAAIVAWLVWTDRV